MKKWLQTTAFCVAGLVTFGASAQQAGLSFKLGDENARVGVFSESEWMSEVYRYDVGFEYNSNQDYVVDLSAMYLNKGLFNPNVDLGFKGKGVFAFMDDLNVDGYAAMLGVYGRFWLPTSVPSALVAEYLVAPQILSFGDADSMNEFMVRGQIQLLRNMNGFIGYRRFNVDFEAFKDVEIEDSVHIGVELSF